MLDRLKSSKLLSLVIIAILFQTAILPVSLRPVQASNLTFGSALNLSNDSTRSQAPVIAVAGSYVYVAWANNNSLGNPEVYFAVSGNGGSSFGPGVKLSNTLAAASPQIAATSSNVYLVWQGFNGTNSNEILFRASTNNGVNFGSIKNLSSDSGDSVSPAIAVSGNSVYVVFQDDVSGPSPSTDVFFSNSTNAGQNFHAKTNLSKDKKSTNPQIAAVGTNIYVDWVDNSSPPDEIYFKASTDNGNSFTTSPTNLSKSPTAASYVQQIAAVGTNVFVVWEDDLPCPTPCTNDVYVAASINSGSTFGNPINLSNNGNSVNPVVAASGTSAYVAWENHASLSGSTVSLNFSSNNGLNFVGAGNFGSSTGFAQLPQIAAVGTNVYLTWYDTTGTGDVFFVSSSDSAQTFGGTQNLSNNIGGSIVPVVAGSGNNVYVAWQDDTPGNDEILFKVGTAAVPDVAISAIAPSRAFAYSGVTANPIIVSVTASNPGLVTASFIVSVKANSAFIASNQTVTNLTTGANVVLQFSWNTASLVRGNYTLTAYASQVTPLGETNLSNNVLTWSGVFTIRPNGDVNGDCATNHVIDIVDVATDAASFGTSLGSPSYNPYADVNNDAVVNIVDVATVAAAFGTTC